jgi:RND superfamily putative drug exporter
MSRLLFRLGGWSVRRRKLMVVAWLIVLVGSGIVGRTAGGEFNEAFSLPGAESDTAYNLLEERFTDQFGARSQVVVFSEDGLADDQDAIDGIVARLEALPFIGEVAPPAVSPFDGTAAIIGFITVGTPADLPNDGLEILEAEVLDPARADGLQAEIGGDLPRFLKIAETGAAEGIGIVVAVFVLVIAFGSFLAMGLPLGVAIFGLITSSSLILILAAFVDISPEAGSLSAMIGIGVGIDYALFIVTRHRQHLREGMTVEESAARANATSGQAVVFAGVTVVIAILGLAIVGIPMITSMGMASAITVFVMVAGSITLLPALLGFAGLKLLKISLPWQRKKIEAQESIAAKHAADGTVPPRTGWQRWGDTVTARPWAWLIGSVTVLLLLAVPMFSLRLGQPDAGNEPRDSTERKAYDLITEHFIPGLNGPLVLVTDISESPAGSVGSLVATLKADDNIAVVLDPFANEANDTAVTMIIPISSPQDEATTSLVHRIRGTYVPASGSASYLGGATASFIDASDRVSSRLPVFIAAVVGMSFLLLMLVFRSVLVPVKAALMNLLSIGAAYGVVVAVFQWGWGLSLVGIEEPLPIISFIPMFMFAILFGLSMDYEVFLLSRVREEYLSGKSNTESVIEGISSTARVITSAALIMISVFMGFVLAPNPVMQMMGLGLATAIFVDATIVRVIVVPASMKLMGNANWWLPKWLDNILPRLDIEGASGLPVPRYRDDVSPPAATPVAAPASVPVAVEVELVDESAEPTRRRRERPLVAAGRD